MANRPVKRKTKKEMEILALIAKIEEQMRSIEDKVDLLINRTIQAASAPPASAPEPVYTVRHIKPDHYNDRRPKHQDFRAKPMYRTICADCKNECEVPFRPRDGRQVFCKVCYSNRKKGKFSNEPVHVEDKTAEETKIVETIPAKKKTVSGKKTAAKKKTSVKKKAVIKKKTAAPQKTVKKKTAFKKRAKR